MQIKRLRHELNKVYCYIRHECTLGKEGAVLQLSAGSARKYDKEVMVVPSLRKLKTYPRIYSMMGYPVANLIEFLEDDRRQNIKRLGQVVPQWKKLSERMIKEDEESQDAGLLLNK
eukprot:NODE_13_length_54415_cov_0.522424.p50 type:complete len:116 gc:universal NODE_13_length_54415_cov_0.522424:16012-16359(+)